MVQFKNAIIRETLIRLIPPTVSEELLDMLEVPPLQIYMSMIAIIQVIGLNQKKSLVELLANYLRGQKQSFIVAILPENLIMVVFQAMIQM